MELKRSNYSVSNTPKFSNRKRSYHQHYQKNNFLPPGEQESPLDVSARDARAARMHETHRQDPLKQEEPNTAIDHETKSTFEPIKELDQETIRKSLTLSNLNASDYVPEVLSYQSIQFSFRTKKGYIPNNPGKVNQDTFVINSRMNNCNTAHFFGV